MAATRKCMNGAHIVLVSSFVIPSLKGPPYIRRVIIAHPLSRNLAAPYLLRAYFWMSAGPQGPRLRMTAPGVAPDSHSVLLRWYSCPRTLHLLTSENLLGPSSCGCTARKNVHSIYLRSRRVQMDSGKWCARHPGGEVQMCLSLVTGISMPFFAAACKTAQDNKPSKVQNSAYQIKPSQTTDAE